ncbi:MAG TPA: hypothetical protein VM677_20780 [Actinokineospora sp.]|nr:hypothetical protein [Actinokineospora sp.]
MPATTEEPELEDSVGTAAAGAVRVVVRNRRILSVEIDPGVLRQPPGAVSGLLREAVNPALAQSLTDTPAVGDPGPDLAALGAQLAEFTRQGGQALRRIQDAIDGSMAKLADRTGIHGDASPQYVDFLFQDALDVVGSARAALSADPARPVTGEGRDEADEVSATVTGGEVTVLDLTVVAVRLSGEALGRAVRQAVNTALETWERQAGATERAALDVAALREVGERAQKVREQSMQHLRTYTNNLTSIMRNID